MVEGQIQIKRGHRRSNLSRPEEVQERTRPKRTREDGKSIKVSNLLSRIKGASPIRCLKKRRFLLLASKCNTSSTKLSAL